MPRSDWLLARLGSAVKRRQVSHALACMLRMVPVTVPVPGPGHAASRLWWPTDECLVQIRAMICSTARGIDYGLLATQTESALVRAWL